MDATRWERIKSRFAATTKSGSAPSAFPHPSPEEEALRKKAEALLAAYENSMATVDGLVSPSSTSILGLEKVLSGRYKIVWMIGRGGMGEVYEAEDLELRTRVAIKLIRPEIAAQADMLERFKREVHLARKVTHPNVCRIFDLGFHTPREDEKLAFLTMELLAGETLAHRIARDGPMKTAEALPLLEQMAAGLNAAHQAGVIHRDFKSANIMLVAGGPKGQATVKITDFGLARATNPLDRALTTMTGSAMFVGTPAFVAPEQVEGSEVTPAADIYALGVVMYQMVTGRLPFAGDTPWSVVVKRLKQPPPAPRIHAPGLDPNWDAAILRCLEIEPGARFSTTLDVVRAVQGQSTVPAQPVRREKKEFPMVTVAISALVILSGLAAGYSYWSRKAAGRHDVSASLPAAILAQHGWSVTSLSADASLFQISTAVSVPDSTQVLLFGPSLLRVWEAGSNVQPPVSTAISAAGQAECSSGLWLVDDDHQHITQWDPDKQKALQTIAAPAKFHSAACLDDAAARWGFLVNDEQAYRWVEFDATSNKILSTTPLGESFVKATVDPQRRYLALLSGENVVSIRELDHLEEILRDTLTENLLTNPISSWSESGRYLALGFKQLAIYDLQNNKRIGTLPVSGWITGAGWISDQGLTAMDDRGRLYWTSNPRKNWEFTQDAPDTSVYKAFWLASQYRWLSVGQAGRVRVWDYVTPSLLFDWPISPIEIWSIAPNGDRASVAVSGKDSNIYIGDIQHQKIVQTLTGHTDGVTFVRFSSPDRLISASDDATIRGWDASGGKLLQTVHGHSSLVNAFAISPDGQWMVSVGSDSKIKTWRLPDLSPAKDVGTTRNSGAAAAFPIGDGQHLLISDWRGGLDLYQGDPPNWSLQTQSRLGKSVIYMLCAGRDAVWAVVPNGEAAGLWSVTMKDIGHPARITAVPAHYCFTSSDGKLTAVVYSNQVELRSNQDNAVVATYFFSAQDAFSVAIQNTPPAVLVGQANGHLRAWPLPPNALRDGSPGNGQTSDVANSSQ